MGVRPVNSHLDSVLGWVKRSNQIGLTSLTEVKQNNGTTQNNIFLTNKHASADQIMHIDMHLFIFSIHIQEHVVHLFIFRIHIQHYSGILDIGTHAIEHRDSFSLHRDGGSVSGTKSQQQSQRCFGFPGPCCGSWKYLLVPGIMF